MAVGKIGVSRPPVGTDARRAPPVGQLRAEQLPAASSDEPSGADAYNLAELERLY